MDAYHVRSEPGWLNGLDKEEATLFVCFTRAITELQLLFKLCFMFNKPISDKYNLTAKDTQSFFFFLLLLSKLHQANVLDGQLRSLGNGRISQWVTRRLSEVQTDDQLERFRQEAINGRDQLKIFCNENGNRLAAVRNIQFHSPINEVKDIISGLKGDEVFEMLLSNSRGGALYISSDEIFNKAVEQAYGKNRMEMIDEVMQVCRSFLDYAFYILSIVDMTPSELKTVSIPNAAKARDSFLPYFFEPDE